MTLFDFDYKLKTLKGLWLKQTDFLQKVNKLKISHQSIFILGIIAFTSGPKPSMKDQFTLAVIK